jgi:hypothetical protein
VGVHIAHSRAAERARRIVILGAVARDFRGKTRCDRAHPINLFVSQIGRAHSRDQEV